MGSGSAHTHTEGISVADSSSSKPGSPPNELCLKQQSSHMLTAIKAYLIDFMREETLLLFREYRPRVHVQFLDNGTKVSALNPKTYVFEPQKSVGDPRVDLIRTINIPAVVSSLSFLLRNHPNALDNQQLHTGLSLPLW